MKMNRWYYLLAIRTLLTTGCTNNTFKNNEDGTEYRVFNNAKGKKANKGNFLQLNIVAKYKNSVLFSSFENNMPSFISFDTAQLPLFLKTINENDNIILKIPTDTLIKKRQVQPYMKKNEFIYQYFKVSKVFPTKKDVDKVAKTYETKAKSKSYSKVE